MIVRACLSIVVAALVLPACTTTDGDQGVGTVDLQLTGQARETLEPILAAAWERTS